MSKKSWQEQLQTILTPPSKRLAIVGIGHELRGDDAVGVLIVRKLQKTLKQTEQLLLVDAGVAPENFTGQLRRFLPTVVLLIDAVDMGKNHGTVAMIDLKSKFVEPIASTHSLSLHLFTDYFQRENDCAIYLLGIQPMSTTFEQSLSSPVQMSLLSIVQCILNSSQ